MFGRRNPDRPLETPPQPAQPQRESDLDLDMLDELPDTPAPEQKAEPAFEEPPRTDLPPDHAWHTATPAILNPSVTRLLQEAEAAQHRATLAEAGHLTASQAGAVTQQLTSIAAPQPAPTLPTPAQPSAASAPQAQPARARSVAESVIGPDDFFDGRYRSERGVRIQGNARGSIESRQYIFVEAGAQVEADLSAEDITVSGDFKGKIVCRRKLEVTATGKIHGEVQTSLLVVQEGGALDGELHMRDQENAGAADAQ